MADIKVDIESATSADLEKQAQPASLIPKATDLSWKDLEYVVKVKKEKKTILQKSNGYVGAGEFLAVMGPSGSGKTTLLDAIAGRLGTKGTITGEVLFNNQQIKSKLKRKVLSYVAQEDTLYGNFTVRETIKFAARFHYGYTKSSAQIQEIVSTLVESMGLKACENTIVGDLFRKGLSGGQKRRLSMAVELVSNPAILLLDEPTSGLDSASALGVVRELIALAKQGHTIVTTIHQPSSEIWGLFDMVCFMSKGQTVYFGKAKDAIQYFGNLDFKCPTYNNPADYFMGLINTDFKDGDHNPEESLKKLSDAFQDSTEKRYIVDRIDGVVTDMVMEGDQNNGTSTTAARKVDSVTGHGKEGASWFSSFLTLCHRNMLNNFRNPGIYWVRFVMYCMLCLMIGFMYWDLGNTFTSTSIVSRTSLIFFVAAFLVFMSVAVLPFFIEERKYFLRERTNGAYGVSAYVIANWLCSLPGIAIIALCSTACVVLPSGINGFGYFFLTLFLALLTAEAYMCLVASVVPHYIVGIAMGAGTFGFFMLCQGFFIVYPDIPDWFIWGYYIAFHTYGFKAFMNNEFRNIEHFDDARMPNGEAVLEYYGIKESADMAVDLPAIFAFGILFQLIFSFVLYRYHTGQR